MSKPPAKVLLWDIEASALEANRGFVFCIGWKWLGLPKVNLIRHRDAHGFKKNILDDRYVLREFSKIFNQADMHVAHYGGKYDLPFIQTRLMMHGMAPLANVPIIDTWRISRFKLKLSNNRLDTISRAAPVQKGQKREEKTYLDVSTWIKAATGHIPSIKYIEDHCIADVKVLEQTYLAIRAFAGPVPNLSKVGGVSTEGCPTCSSPMIQRRGYKLTERGNKQQYQCQTCKHWFCAPMRPKG